MKLLIRTVTGEEIEFDVLPGDTFGDLSQRLRELGKVEINFNQLSRNDSSLDMSANVMEYINARSIQASGSVISQVDSDSQSDTIKDIKNDNEQIESNGKDGSNNINTEASSSNNSQELPCATKNNYSPMFSIGFDEELVPEENEIVFKNEVEDVVDLPSKVICRLCAQLIDSSDVRYLFDEPPPGEIITLAEKINYSLPLYVTQEDVLPKQVCVICLPQLETAYKFARKVSKSADLLDTMEFNIPPANENFHCPFCVGHMSCNCTQVENIAFPFSDLNIVGIQTIEAGENGYYELPNSHPDDLTDELYAENIVDGLEEVDEKNNYINHQTETNSIEEFPTGARRKRGRPKKNIEKKSYVTIENDENGDYEIPNGFPEDLIQESYAENIEDAFVELDAENMYLNHQTETNSIEEYPTGARRKRGRPKKNIEKKLNETIENDENGDYEIPNGFPEDLIQESCAENIGESIVEVDAGNDYINHQNETNSIEEYPTGARRKRGRPKKNIEKKTDEMIENDENGGYEIPNGFSEDLIQESCAENIGESIVEVDAGNDYINHQNETNSIEEYPTGARRKRGRPKKNFEQKSDESDDKDWSAKDELKPIKKRGRPKGSRNKTRVVPKTEVECLICEQSFSDIPSVLSHSLLCHCEEGSDTLPCPLCDSVWPDEGELVHHVNKHSPSHQTIINPCMLCSKAYKVKEELEHHLIEHLDQDANVIFRCVCALCKEEFSTPVDMSTHLKDEHANGARNMWKCPHCSSRFNGEEEYMHHFQTVHMPLSGPEYSCPKCPTTETLQYSLVRHLLAEHSSKYVIQRPLTYKCPACDSKFKTQYSIIKHPCAGIGNKFYCEQCDVRFTIKARYVLHLQVHNKAAMFEMRCDVCLAEFTEEGHFYDHIRFQHETEENLKCSKCNKMFKNRNSLSLHLRRHQKIRNHKCETCGKTFMNAQTLREHKVSHMKVKPYQCDQCGQCLSRPSRLRLHLRSHSVHRSTNSMICYSCPECLQVFPNLDQVQSHYEQHETKSTEANFLEIPIRQVLRCEFCNACYTTHDHLNQHRNTNHDMNDEDQIYPFSCSICKTKFSSYARVATHKLTHGITTETLILKNDGPVYPLLWRRIFLSLPTLNDSEEEEREREEDSTPWKKTDQNTVLRADSHETKLTKQFTVPQYFLCEVCNKECLHYTYLNMHRKMCHPQSSPSHACKDCPQMFPTAWALHYHRRKMHNLRSKLHRANKSFKKDRDSSDDDLYECPYCLRQYASPETLDIHMKRLHVHSSANYAGYVCETCGKTFAFKGSWQSHLDSHNGIKRFHCKECDKRFTHKAGLTKHMKLHSPDRPFLCEYCGKKFRDRTERDNHIRAHTGERPYMCDICGRRFRTRAVWLDHSRIHQDIRPHHCDQCGQSFRRSFALKSHYLIHTGERPFQCKYCEKDFRLKQSLSTHIKKDHENITDSLQNQAEVEGTVEVSNIVEGEIIDFQNYHEFVTEPIIDNNESNSQIISKSELIPNYESEMEVDQEKNLEEQIAEQVIFVEKSQSSLNTPPRINKSENLEYSEINFSESDETKVLKRTLNIPVIYNGDEELKKKKKLCDTTQALSSADLPIIQELCHVMDETTDSK